MQEDNGLALSRFIRLSKVLTGFDDLNLDHARIYLQNIENTGQGETLKDIFSRIDDLEAASSLTLEQLRARGLLAEDPFREVLACITRQWFTGTCSEGGKTVVVTDTGALAWHSLDFADPPTIGRSPGFWQTNPYAVE